MTEAEFIGSFSALLNVMLTTIGIYLTTLSGYLVAAFLIGSKLTRSQLVIISTIFVVFATLMAFVALSLGERAVLLESEFEGTRDALDYTTYLIFVLQLLGIAAALKFMADIRSTG